MGKAVAKTRGRPSDYTPALATEICERMIESDHGLEQVCAADDMPHVSTVYRWLQAHADFREQYTRAREAQGHVQAERALRDALTADDPQKGRLKFDARKWAASKLAPKQYGDAVNLKHSDPDGGPVRINDVQRAARIAALLEAVRGRLPEN
jgi:hypothetical protein